MELAEQFGASWATDFRIAVETASGITTACLYVGKRVLIEKPGGRGLAEVSAVTEVAAAGWVAKVGYNHRFHPAVRRSRRAARL
jgi:predicted dehydrogenase